MTAEAFWWCEARSGQIPVLTAKDTAVIGWTTRPLTATELADDPTEDGG